MNDRQMVNLLIPVEHYEQHVALEASLASSSNDGSTESDVDPWPQPKVDFWYTTSGAVTRQVFDHLAEVAPAVKTTSDIVTATGLPKPTVRNVFAALGRRTKRNKRLIGPWPVHAQWNGQEVEYHFDPEMAARWATAKNTK